jgi:hypothetical protein
MLPDAGYRLKWTYGVEAFQQWCAQRNRPILYPSATTTPEGILYLTICFYSNSEF